MTQPRIIHILGTLTPYTLVSDGYVPATRWETSTGTWVGVFDQHWSDLLCRAVLGVTQTYAHEVWQPDLRADRVYAHTFDDGLRHVLYPARCPGLSGNEFALDPFGIECPTLYSAIAALSEGTVLQLNELTNSLTEAVLRRLPEEHVPVVLHQYGGTTYATLWRSGRNPVRRFRYWLRSFEQRRLCRRIDHMIAHTHRQQDDLRRVYGGPMSVRCMGLDFDFWVPGDKAQARHALDLPGDRFVLLTGSMLRPKKQLDWLLRVLLALDRQGYDFLYLVVGGGEPDYECILRELAQPLLERDKVRFLGRVSDPVLLRAYQAADLFLSVSSMEGGPVSVMNAFACQVPVLTTDVGHVAEFIHGHGLAGIVPDAMPMWQERLGRILDGEPVPVVPRELARATYDWTAVGRHFASVYRDVLTRRGITVGLE